MKTQERRPHAGVQPGGRDVVVTGAAGGVGSIAIALLAAKGFRVVASTGRVEETDYLQKLGAAEVIGRDVLSAESKRPMETERWAGAVDTVGGVTLAGIIRTLQQNGAVAACGLAGGAKLDTTVFPFILRGVSLLGINSVEVANSERRRIWALLAQHHPQPANGRPRVVQLRGPLAKPTQPVAETHNRVALRGQPGERTVFLAAVFPAAAEAIRHLGLEGVGRVRIGKLIELELPDATPEAEIHRISRDLLSNPVIEDYSISRP